MRSSYKKTAVVCSRQRPFYEFLPSALCPLPFFTMLLILSPSTTLDFDTPAPLETHTQPAFLVETETLVTTLRKFSVDELGTVLGTSNELTQLNFERYQQWTRPCTRANSKQALYAFAGAAYEGLDAPSLDTAVVTAQAQPRLRLLSGLYGILRPLDLIQPHRLELKTKLTNPTGDSLYPFWQDKVTAVLNDDLAALGTDILLDLASGEYSKLVKKRQFHGRVVTCGFKEWDSARNKYRTISFFAKKARGQMVRFILKEKINTLEELKQFSVEGYRFNTAVSKPNLLTFTRGE